MLREEFGYLPLAINQAGRYIHATSNSYHGYLKKYKANASLYLGPEGNINQNERCVLATWELSFESIQKQNPEVAELLLLCGFLGNDDICEDLIRRGKKLSEDGMSAFITLILQVYPRALTQPKSKDIQSIQRNEISGSHKV